MTNGDPELISGSFSSGTHVTNTELLGKLTCICSVFLLETVPAATYFMKFLYENSGSLWTEFSLSTISIYMMWRMKQTGLSVHLIMICCIESSSSQKYFSVGRYSWTAKNLLWGRNTLKNHIGGEIVGIICWFLYLRMRLSSLYSSEW